jgi:predicted nucleotide-binding protein
MRRSVRVGSFNTTEDSNGDSNADGPGAADPRARQNVILEHGFFTRKSVVDLHRGEGELPSDCDGVLYTTYVRNLQPE